MTPKDVVAGILAVSLSVNGWLITNRVTDINDTLNKMIERIGDLRSEQAAIKNQTDNNTADIAQLRSRHNHKDD